METTDFDFPPPPHPDEITSESDTVPVQSFFSDTCLANVTEAERKEDIEQARIPPVDFTVASNEEFVSAADFANANDPSQWDFLLAQNSGTQSSQTASKWERESLYLKFDPLVKPTDHNFTVPSLPVSCRQKPQEFQESRQEQLLEKPTAMTNSPLISIYTPPTKPIQDNRKQTVGNRRIEKIAIVDPFMSPKVKNEAVDVENDRISTENAGNSELDQWNDIGHMTVIQEETSLVLDESHSNRREALTVRSDDTVQKNAEGHENQSDDFKFMCPPPPKMSAEVFVSSDALSYATDTAEWDMLIERGTGAQSQTSKWERESLYQKFDPLLSSSLNQPKTAISKTVPPLKERNQADNIDASGHKILSTDTPLSSQARSRVHGTFSNNITDTENLISVVDFDQKKEMLTSKLEQGKKMFQAEMQSKSVKLKELEDSIKATAKELERQQKVSNFKKDYETIIMDLESQITKTNRDIINAKADNVHIIESKENSSDDLRQAEVAFSDLHSKYELTKKLLSNFKENEQLLNSRYEEMKTKLENRETKLRRLQESAEEKLRCIKQDVGTALKSEESEINRLRAQYRKVEVHMSTLEKDVEQKQIENKKLSQLCDDLIKGQARA